jgi:hypothetical protein
MEKDFLTKWGLKTSKSSYVLIWQTDFKEKLGETKEGHFILIKGTIHQEEVAIINIYAPNIGAPNFIKQTLLDKESTVRLNTIKVGNFNTSLSLIGRLTQQRNFRIKENYRQNGLTIHLQNILSNIWTILSW